MLLVVGYNWQRKFSSRTLHTNKGIIVEARGLTNGEIEMGRRNLGDRY